MAEVDADDDTIRRFVVLHYRYDPARRQRRDVVMAAYDDESEFQARIKELAASLRARRETGELSDPRERISGVTLEPGHLALQRNAHLLRRAMEHGVVPDQVRDLPLPPGIAIVTATRGAGDQLSVPDALICRRDSCIRSHHSGART